MLKSKDTKLCMIRESSIIAIMRASSSELLLQAADAIKEGGVTVIEVTMNTPGALEVIQKAQKRYGDDILFGAGSVLDPESARAAILAGAQFVVGPTLNLLTVALCRRYSIPVIPGAYTPTEVLTAWEAGADMVKIFPCSIGGPAYIKAIKAPLPQVEVVPVGGVTLENIPDFIRAGAAAIGVGDLLVNQELLEKKDFGALTARAHALCEAARRT